MPCFPCHSSPDSLKILTFQFLHKSDFFTAYAQQLLTVETDCDDGNTYFLKMLTNSPRQWLLTGSPGLAFTLQILKCLPLAATLGFTRTGSTTASSNGPISGYLQFHQNWFLHCRSFKSLPPAATHTVNTGLGFHRGLYLSLKPNFKLIGFLAILSFSCPAFIVM